MTVWPRQGLFVEDLTPGLEIESPGRTVAESDIMLFAGLSGDYNVIHTDAEFAKGTPYGERIAHGLLGLAIASGLAARSGALEGTVLAFTGLEWKFKAPIKIGDTIRLRARVEKTRPLPSMGGGMVVLAVKVLNQRDEVVQSGTWSLLMKSRNG
ncbi:MAG: MaoC family dehydratase N-terminal domain-containing protein [Chloroflexi bacterium]|nr:MaoC family dehydratase N-terminal domain-containing protein [Chloroflexota bacterium]